MNPWYALIPVTCLMVLGSVFSYRDDLRNGKWYVPVFMISVLLTGVIWIWVTRTLNDKTKIYYLSLVWDFLMILSYYVLPLLIFEFKMNKGIAVGVMMMIAGLIVVKIYGN